MVGLGVFDCLAREMVDSETGEIYPALSCCNDKAMAERCVVPNAEPRIWSIKANAAFNSDAAMLLREGFRSGRLRLLATEYDADNILSGIKGFNSLNAADKMLFRLPYIQTTLLVDELVKLQHEEINGRVRLYERAKMRKDRYSSLLYNYYVANQIESKLSRQIRNKESINNMFIIKPPSGGGKEVSSDGTKHRRNWQ